MIHKVLPQSWKWCKQGEQLEDSSGMLMRDHHGEENAKRLGRRGINAAPDAEEHPVLICSTGQSPG